MKQWNKMKQLILNKFQARNLCEDEERESESLQKGERCLEII